MPITITYDGNTPTVGADADVWGAEINTALAQIKADLVALEALAETVETAATAAAAAATAAQTTANAAAQPGKVSAFARSTPPTGWLACDGSVISQTTYAALYGACGTFYNDGTEAAGTFRIPDLRGAFIRGVDNGRGLDPSRAFGSYQADELAAHVHSISPPTSGGTGGQGLSATGSDVGETITPFDSGSAGGTETRPKNVAMLFCIKT